MHVVGIIVAAAFHLGQASAIPSVDTIRYHVHRRIVLDSAGADFLAIDPIGRRLYGAGDRVIDIESDSVVGRLPAHTGFGFALAGDLGRGIGRRGVIFDLHSLEEVGRVSVRGDASAYDKTTHRAFLVSDTTSGVDLQTGAMGGTVVLGKGTESAVADGRGHVFVAMTDENALAVVDAHELRVVRHIELQH